MDCCNSDAFKYLFTEVFPYVEVSTRHTRSMSSDESIRYIDITLTALNSSSPVQIEEMLI